MGREMHSVISQGRVEEIVSSKPRDRRLLIEEAAGLGKHRKRRHSAQLKLDRTRDNLERALDVEREARSRLRPLKRQAEAAERTAKLEPRSRTSCARGSSPTTCAPSRSSCRAAEAKLAEVRATRDSVEKRFEEVRGLGAPRSRSGSRPARRGAAATASGWPRRARRPSGFAPGRSPSISPSGICARALGERQLRLEALDDGAGSRTATAARIAELEAELEQARRGRLRGGRAAAPRGRGGRAAPGARPRRPSSRWSAPRRRPERPCDRRPRCTRGRAPRRRRRPSAGRRLPASWPPSRPKLAAAAVEGEHEALAGHDRDRVGPRAGGLGGARRAAARIDRRLGRRGPGAARAAPRARPAALVCSRRSRAMHAPSLAEGRRPAPARPDRGPRATPRPITERLLADAWLVDDLDGIAGGLRGGRGHRRRRVLRRRGAGEIRRLPREGTDPALAARSEREELASRLAQREQTEERASTTWSEPRRLSPRRAAARRSRRARCGTPPRARPGRRGGEPDELARRASRRARRRGLGDGASSAPSSRPSWRRSAVTPRRAEKATRSGLRDRERARAADRAGAARPCPRLAGRARRCARLGAAARAPASRQLAAAEGEDGGETSPPSCASARSRSSGSRRELREASEAMTVAEVEATQLRGQPRREHGRARAPRRGPRRGAWRRQPRPCAEEERERDRGQARAAGAQPRADRPGQPAGRARVRGGARARHRARRAAQGPGEGDHGAARADPPHRQGDRRGLRGDLRGHRPRLRGDGGRALPGREGTAAPRRRRRSAAPLRGPGARAPKTAIEDDDEEVDAARTRTAESRSRSRRRASRRGGSRCSPAARSRWWRSPSSSPS